MAEEKTTCCPACLKDKSFESSAFCDDCLALFQRMQAVGVGSVPSAGFHDVMKGVPVPVAGVGFGTPLMSSMGNRVPVLPNQPPPGERRQEEAAKDIEQTEGGAKLKLKMKASTSSPKAVALQIFIPGKADEEDSEFSNWLRSSVVDHYGKMAVQGCSGDHHFKERYCGSMVFAQVSVRPDTLIVTSFSIQKDLPQPKEIVKKNSLPKPSCCVELRWRIQLDGLELVCTANDLYDHQYEWVLRHWRDHEMSVTIDEELARTLLSNPNLEYAGGSIEEVDS